MVQLHIVFRISLISEVPVLRSIACAHQDFLLFTLPVRVCGLARQVLRLPVVSA